MMQMATLTQCTLPRNAENLVWGNGEDSLLKEGIGLWNMSLVGNPKKAVARMG